MKYYVNVGGQEFEVEINGDQVVVDGQALSATLSAVPGTPLRHLVLDGRSMALAVQNGGRGSWTLTHRGERHEVEVIDERTRHIRSLTGGAAGRAAAGTLRAPMPGLVVRVEVEPGQAVRAGQGVVVLEAMKMENELRAPADGTVKTVKAQPGQPVEKGEVLVEFEAPSS